MRIGAVWLRCGAGCYGLRAEQAASEYGLHLTTSVSNQVNNDLFACDTVDHAVGVEEGLAVFLIPSPTSSFG